MGACIGGTVRDEAGRPLARIRVVAAHEPTGSLLARLTDPEGRFLFDNIRVGGPYALTATGDGFEAVQNRLQLKTEQAAQHDFVLITARERH